MRDALELLVRDVPHQIVMLDVDQDPALLSLYDELVPVLYARKSVDPEVATVGSAAASAAGEQLCHYFLDVDKVKAFCDE